MGQLVLKGSVRSSSYDADERAACVVGIGIGLFSLFGDRADAEIDWLNHPRAKLQNRSPIAFMLEGSIANIFAVVDMVKHERGL